MVVIENKLTECMKTVFPTVPEQELVNASMESLAQWDSLATVTIAALIEEDFGIEIDPEDLSKLTSYQSIASFLNQQEARKQTNAAG
jgi:acyl carrier protein